MDREYAYGLLCNLLERAAFSDNKTFLTSQEIKALSLLVDTIGQTQDSNKESPRSFSGATLDVEVAEESSKQPRVENQPVLKNNEKACLPQTELNIADEMKDASDVSGLTLCCQEIHDISADTMLCVDFGTSFSKAFVSIGNEYDTPILIDLPIGDGSTGTKLTTPSEMLIENDFIYLGSRARQRYESVEGPDERLIDSIKHYITLYADVSSLHENRLTVIQDPTQRFSLRDVLVLYLAHLMATTEAALVNKNISPNIRRRFTHPAWHSANHDKNEKEMRILMSEAILLARSAQGSFLGRISTSDARNLLDQMREKDVSFLPTKLIHEAVREATAAGAGALLNTPENMNTNYLVIDIGAGTTDVAAFACINSPEWDRPRVFEYSNAAHAIRSAGNRLDYAFYNFVLGKSSLVQNTPEYRAASMSLKRDCRLYKERLFSAGQVIVRLPTDENITVTLDEFENYEYVKNFYDDIFQVVGKSAFSVIVKGRLKLIATGGGASLPIIKMLEKKGVEQNGKHINFVLQDAVVSSVRENYPDLIDPYPQIAVALGGSLPYLPEQRGDILGPKLDAPPTPVIQPSYKS